MKFDNKLRTYVNDRNNNIKVYTTGHYYDYVGCIENNNNYPIKIILNVCTEYDEWQEEYIIKENDWIGIMANSECLDILRTFRHRNYEIKEVC